MTEEVLEDNRMKAAEEKIAFGVRPQVGGERSISGPIKHVIYIIRENRTYDQVLGDLEVDGKPVGNGDPSLTMYGEEVTPNLHKLALQFGVLDNFYDSAEVVGDGHVWSNTGIGTDYLERTWQLNYRGKQHGYDYEGVVSEGIPLEQGIADVNEPAERVSVGESGEAWEDAVSLWRVHQQRVLHGQGQHMCAERSQNGADAGREIVRGAELGEAGRAAAGGLGRGGEQVAMGDSAAGE